MIESEAKKKWCPFVRISDTKQAHGKTEPALSVNRWDDETNLCIGSSCMAWRQTFRKATKMDADLCDLYGVGDDIPTGGYCGLAGRSV